MASYGQIGTGIIPLPGTPAYEQALRNMLNAQNPNDATAQAQQEALGAFDTLRKNTGVDYGIAQPTIDRMLMGSAAGSGGSGGYGSSSSSSTPGAGAGLMEEILGLIRGTGEKQFGAARDRLNEDYGTARQQKVADLARRGLFRAGVGEKEMQQEIERPYSRGISDLEANMADANTDLGLRKAAILGDIEAQARRAAAERSASQYQQGAQTGSGGYDPFASQSQSSQSLNGSEGEGGIFGATFTNARKASLAGGGGGGSSPLGSGYGGTAYDTTGRSSASDVMGGSPWDGVSRPGDTGYQEVGGGVIGGKPWDGSSDPDPVGDVMKEGSGSVYGGGLQQGISSVGPNLFGGALQLGGAYAPTAVKKATAQFGSQTGVGSYNY